jgi:hypothetical protein
MLPQVASAGGVIWDDGTAAIVGKGLQYSKGVVSGPSVAADH